LYYTLIGLNIRNYARESAQPVISGQRVYPIILGFPSYAEQQAIVSQVDKLFNQIDQLYALAQKRLNYREKSAKALFNKLNHAENDTELQETWQTLTAHFHTLTQSKESVKQLRQSILQMAVQGKLTAKWREHVKTQGLASPDDPNYNASSLLEKIKAEKKQLLKDGEIKKDIFLPEISDEEIYCHIPNNWVWCRLLNITSILGDGLHGTPNYKNTGDYYFINGNNLRDGKIEFKSNTKKVDKDEFEKYKKPLNKRTVLVSINGTLGNVGLYFDEKVILGKSACYFNLLNGVEREYVKVFIDSNYFMDYATYIASETTIKNVSLKAMRLMLIPLPPVKEQKAIVSKVKQLIAWCDELEKKIEKRDAYQEKMMQAVVKNVLTAD